MTFVRSGPTVIRSSRRSRDRLIELTAFAAILALAAVLRFADLPTRGTWDADQGHDMLVLRDFVDAGRIPLLGPPTSIGDFHHGMLYYVLLAPAAALSGADPTAVTAWIALGGLLAVAVTGWLARAVGGPLAGLVAALLMAVSASAVAESTFIWNPNLIALSSSVALAAAWQAWRGRRPRWWVAAGAASVVTMHCHVLGVILTPIVVGLLVADIRRRRAIGDAAGARAVTRSGFVWLALGLVSYLPLAIHELGSGGSEIRAALAFLGAGGGSASVSLPVRIPIVAMRVLAWPLSGLITAAPIASVLAVALVGGLAVWRGWLSRLGQLAADPGSPSAAASEPGAAAGPDEQTAVRWLSLGLAWTTVALAIGATSLATVVPGLPNDHYHAFADPMVFVLVGVGIAALTRFGGRLTDRASRDAIGADSTLDRAGHGRDWLGPTQVVAAVAVVAVVAWNLGTQPPSVAPDGGWPAARAAAARIVDTTGGGPIVLTSLPVFKTAEAVQFALEQIQGRRVVDPAAPDATRASRVVLCDQLFRDAIGADCGGPAEDVLVATLDAAQPAAAAVRLIDRFEAAPGRWISVYRRQP